MAQKRTYAHLLRSYFDGRIDALIHLFDMRSQYNKYSREAKQFVEEVKQVIDDFLSEQSPEIQEMYYKKYRDGIPFGDFYNIVAPTNKILALNADLKQRVEAIKQPERFYIYT
ncbi:hypothetical protein [Leuconostoc fallax]|uniref:Uncharacterized protein n=1 Tax=Leuconostoc fallax TaxID=1251 RepID=A0A4R5N7E4_9LACO|nr:hypothetical protein [Leuconostoc fallax]MBU7455218.1 hypothetical protein [Leuconostoc fallax]TDG67679.1 hypothetical protein C5L23_001478 [Leuconostoc fallax]